MILCSGCGHCCCHQEKQVQPEQPPSPPSQGHSVTFSCSPAPAPATSTPPLLKPVLKNSGDTAGKKVELRVNTNASRPRPRSVAVPNPASSGAGLYSLDEARLVSLPMRHEVGQTDFFSSSVFNMNLFDWCL